ncbi:unnamed protein product [Staurois parvus]|uniref:Uncharacterized protein n=1 Tax=Staurois parvus TaxID=386267 RepID=A0ABN9AZC2_9NEOB|nr:unnamed protein product [Staurois parvus]
MISVAPTVPPVTISASCQCSSMPPASAHQCHINDTYQCQSVPPVNAISAAYQCHQCHLSVQPISVIYECCLSVPISDACQFPSVPPTSASSSVPISATYQCPSVQPISAHHCSLIIAHQ